MQARWALAASARRPGALIALVSALACGTDEAPARDSATLAASGGIIADSGAVPMRVADYRLTRDRLDDWRGAQQAVSQLPEDTAFEPLHVADADDPDVDRTVAYIDSRPEMRAAIEQSGLSVRDYVLTTLALARADLVARRPEESSRFVVAEQNRAFVSGYGDELRRSPMPSRFRIVDDEDSDGRRRIEDADSDDREGAKGRGRGKGKGKGKAKGRGHDKR